MNTSASQVRLPNGLLIDGPRLKRSIEKLATFGAKPGEGITRGTFSPPYQEALRWLIGYARELGLDAYIDTVGNLFVRHGDRRTKAVLSGSHIDTVPGGGPLDGAYGVLSAIEVAATLRESGLGFGLAFEACAFVEEEGRFYDLLGSKAVAGQLSGSEFDTARDGAGVNLAAAMRECGFDPTRYREAVRRPADIHGFLELHIEQGPVLESKSVPIGVVDEITGGRQVEFRFSGETGHAGTVPMDLRHDAFTPALEFMSETRAMALARGTPNRVRVTFGMVEVRPGFPSKIPAEALIVLEVRDFQQALLDDIMKRADTIAHDAARRHRVELVTRDICMAIPATMDASVRQMIRDAADDLGYARLDMPSGAGHDAQVLASLAPTGMIFVPSQGGISHRQDEWTEFDLLEKGANVLLHTAYRLLSGFASTRPAQ